MLLKSDFFHDWREKRYFRWMWHKRTNLTGKREREKKRRFVQRGRRKRMNLKRVETFLRVLAFLLTVLSRRKVENMPPSPPAKDQCQSGEGSQYSHIGSTPFWSTPNWSTLNWTTPNWSTPFGLVRHRYWVRVVQMRI